MFPFKKKQSEEELEQELQEEEDLKLPSKRKFRDLNSVNKRRRKEPIKPWGKKERYLVLSILLFTTVTSGVLALSARDWKLPGLPKISLPGLNIFGGGEIILENSNKNNNKYKSAIKKFEDKTNSLSGTYGLYVSDLSSRESFGSHETETFQAASLIKLPVMAAYYKEVEKGSVNPLERYILKDSDKVAGSGSIQYEKSGKVYTYQQLVSLMGKQSDNTAFNVVKKKIGEEKLNKYVQEFGMTKTSIVNNDSSPQDIGVFFERLWNGEIMGDENKEALLDSLTNTIYEDYLPAGIPDEIRVAHKYGREVHVLNDAGIVFTDRPFVIVIMTKGIVDKEVKGVFPNLVEDVYVFKTNE
jgi:beta-lactamase class A